MTSYFYKITLSENEQKTITEALEQLIKKCEKQIASGKTAPYIHYKIHSENVLKKLTDNMMPGST